MVVALPFLLLAASNTQPTKTALMTPAEAAVVRRVSANSLRGRLSFLSSDLLEGRDTPSRGLDIAAEYIASVFRRDGLEPGGDDGYLQTAQLSDLRSSPQGFELTLRNGGESLKFDAGAVSLSVFQALDLKNTGVYKLDLTAKDVAHSVHPKDIENKIILMQGRKPELLPALRSVFGRVLHAKPAVVLMLGGDGLGMPESSRVTAPGDDSGFDYPPMVHLMDARAVEFFDKLAPGLSGATASLHVAKPLETTVKAHNVIAILRGSDPKLKDTCVMATAHYDHLGMMPPGPGDRIYNGANDDGSGTVSVMELADALSASPVHPRRSIVFVLFFGEEKGDLGSHYYAAHPAFPIAKTIADINLEQVGRTDSSEGPQIANASVTGFTYSSVTDALVRAGRATGVNIYRHPKNSDPFFARSDNQALADVGVPAHTLGVTFEFPDYHAVGDEWPKIDYENMAKVDRTVALALLRIANGVGVPHWNAQEPKAAPYLKAWRDSHPARP